MLKNKKDCFCLLVIPALFILTTALAGVAAAGQAEAGTQCGAIELQGKDNKRGD